MFRSLVCSGAAKFSRLLVVAFALLVFGCGGGDDCVAREVTVGDSFDVADPTEWVDAEGNRVKDDCALYCPNITGPVYSCDPVTVEPYDSPLERPGGIGGAPGDWLVRADCRALIGPDCDD